MKIAGLDIHPAAELFPLMTQAELSELAQDIAKNGQWDQIALLDGKVLDGRNRLAACEIAQVKPRFVDWNGESPVSYVISRNLSRRHLSISQRAIIAGRAAAMLKKERPLGRPKKNAPVPSIPKGTTSAAFAAKSLSVGARSVNKAIALEKEAPELAQEVRDGKMTLGQAETKIRRAVQVKQAKAYTPPAGEYSVIAADPPWPFDDKLEGVKRELPYPTMSLEEICELKVPAAGDCALFLWCTNSHLIDGSAKRVLDAWGFTPKALITWKKSKIGLGRYVRNRTEQCVIAVKGKPVFVPGTQTSLLEAPVGRHSAKPDQFFRLVEKVCPAKSRLELFAREPRKGWATSGSELEEAEPTLIRWKEGRGWREPWRGRGANGRHYGIRNIGTRRSDSCLELRYGDTPTMTGGICGPHLQTVEDCKRAAEEMEAGSLAQDKWEAKRAARATAEGRCDVQGCGKPKKSRGLCAAHYSAARRHLLAANAAKEQGEKELRAEESRYVAHGTPAAKPKKKAPKRKLEQACRVCGCTEARACVDPKRGPCCWLEEDLCNYCGEALDALAVKLGHEDRFELPKSSLPAAETAVRNAKRSAEGFARFDEQRDQLELGGGLEAAPGLTVRNDGIDAAPKNGHVCGTLPSGKPRKCHVHDVDTAAERPNPTGGEARNG